MLRLVFERLEKILRSKRNYKFFLKDWSHLTDLDQVTTAFETMRFTRKLEPFVTERPNGHHVVVIAPHGDDDIFGCGGTLLKHRAAGGSVTTIYLSIGKPKEESDLREEIATCREALGSKSVFLYFPHNNFPMTEEAVAAFKHAVVEAQPDALFIPAFTDDHDDHRRANEYLLRAFRNDRALNSLEIWAYQVYSVVPTNVVVDITDVAQRKRDLINIFKSQSRSRDWAHYILSLNGFMSRLISTDGKPSYVEGYFTLPLAEYKNILAAYYEPAADCYYTEAYKTEPPA